MKKEIHQLFTLSIVLLCAVFFLGCAGREPVRRQPVAETSLYATTSSISTTTTSSTSSSTTTSLGVLKYLGLSPSEIAGFYFKELLKHKSDYVEMYILISDKAKPDDFNAWTGAKEVVKDAFKDFNMRSSFKGVTNERIFGENASVRVEYTLVFQGISIPQVYNVSLVKEEDVWKLNSDYNLGG